MRKCKSLRPCQGNVNKRTSLLTLSRAMQTIFAIRRFSNSTKVYHSQNLLKLSKSSQDLKFRLTAGTGYKRWANSYSWHKARHKGNKWQIRGNTKPPFGRSWFKSWQLGFFGMYNLLLSCFSRTSADRASAQSLNPHSCKWLRVSIRIIAVSPSSLLYIFAKHPESLPTRLPADNSR